LWSEIGPPPAGTRATVMWKWLLPRWKNCRTSWGWSASPSSGRWEMRGS